MNRDILSVLENIEREKGISREILFSAIESALASAAKRILKDAQTTNEIRVEMSRETGEIKVYHLDKEIESKDFGRIAAQTAKQVILQKIREAEKDVIYAEYKDKLGELISGTVHRFEKGTIIVDLGKTEAIILRSEQSRQEHYRQGDPIKAYLIDVKQTPRGPEILLSRSHPGVVKKMFEMEVPEIYEHIVEIKAAAREAGERTKIAVYSKDDKVDPVGACVGMRGSRVKNIVRDLYGEKIDIVRWNDNLREFVKAAMAPAEIKDIQVNEEQKLIALDIAEDQLSLAIGKHGQNVRLASKLVGYDIDINPGEKAKAKEKKDAAPDAGGQINIDGVGKKTLAALSKAGYDSMSSLAEATVEDLVKVEGIGKVTAQKIVGKCKNAEVDTQVSEEETKTDQAEAEPESTEPESNSTDVSEGCVTE